jgi:hypothetical protein
MTIRPLMAKLLAIFLISISFSCSHRAGIAIVIDPASEREAAAELAGYENALREADGYTVYRLCEDWESPDAIKAKLKDLYQKGKIRGVVFIGDIPIPMVRDAQFFTSAFKMDQTRPRKESSVPSDRFYDDFDLEFEYIDKDDDGDPFFYYSLTSGRDVPLQPDIFSGRIRPTDTEVSTRYEKLRLYLTKAARAHRNPDRLDHIFVFNGSGSIAESKPAHMDEQMSLREHLPWMKTLPEAFTYMDHTDHDPLKCRIQNELMRPELDIAILHHHGDFDTQYFKIKKEDNLTLEDFGNYRPEAKIVIMDACYNAAFNNKDCIANEYIFQEGGTLVAWGGTVNVLQDKWPDEFLGLVAQGYPIGDLNRFSPYLEMHIVGDPTFTFKKEKVCRSADKACLDIRYGKKSPEQLLGILKSSPVSLERHEAFNTIIRSCDHATRLKAVKIAIEDSAEQIQREAVNCFAPLGDPELIPLVARMATLNNASARVRQNTYESLQFFPREQMLSAIEASLDSLACQSADTAYFEKIRTIANTRCGTWDEDIDKLISGELSEKWKMFLSRSFRIYLPAYRLREVRDFADTCSNEVLAANIKEAIEWHRLAYTY